MTYDEQKIFFETFPPHVLTEIVTMVENDTISRNTGKSLLTVYVNTHQEMIHNIYNDVSFDFSKTFEKFFEKEFGAT